MQKTARITEPTKIPKTRSRGTPFIQNTKQTVNINDASNVIIELLDSIQSNLFNQAQSFMDSHTVNVNTWDEFKENINNGFVICGWDGQSESESKIKNETKSKTL